MASDGAKKLVKYMQESGICSNPSLFGTLEEDFEGFLTNAKPVLSEFVHRDYKLEQHHTTYKLRYKLVKLFLSPKSSLLNSNNLQMTQRVKKIFLIWTLIKEDKIEYEALWYGNLIRQQMRA